ncbi:MAG: hypothetical protein ACI30A_03120 [Paludibacteraceae bacterium]
MCLLKWRALVGLPHLSAFLRPRNRIGKLCAKPRAVGYCQSHSAILADGGGLGRT